MVKVYLHRKLLSDHTVTHRHQIAVTEKTVLHEDWPFHKYASPRNCLSSRRPL